MRLLCKLLKKENRFGRLARTQAMSSRDVGAELLEGFNYDMQK